MNKQRPPISSHPKDSLSPEDVVAQQVNQPSPPPLRNRIWKWLRQHPVAFFIAILFSVSGSWIGMAAAKILDPACRWVPIPFRSTPIFFYCTSPIIEGATESDFVLVFVGLDATDNQFDGRTGLISGSIDRILASYAEEYNNRVDGDIGTVYVVFSSNSWVQVVETALPETNNQLQVVSDRFQVTDLVLYGEIKEISNGIQTVNLRGYTPNQKQVSLWTDLMLGNDTWNYDFGEVLIFEGGQDSQAQDWISGIREFTIGLQKQSNAMLRPSALPHFEALAGSSVPQLSAIGYIYMGNFLLEDGLSLQRRDVEAACPISRGCTVVYSDETISMYQQAWYAYTAALVAPQTDPNIRLRALIGRGNIHYRYTQITTYAGEPDLTNLSTADLIDYVCDTDDLSFTNDSDGDAPLWFQHAHAALSCFEEAKAISNPVIALRAYWGAAELLRFLADVHNGDAAAYQKVVDAYTEIINRAEQLAEDTTLDHQADCITALALGERSVVRRYHLGDTDLLNIKVDFDKAIKLLDDPAKCNLGEARENYITELAFLK